MSKNTKEFFLKGLTAETIDGIFNTDNTDSSYRLSGRKGKSMEVRLSGKQSIFEEIAAEYERYIRLGALREGEKLPSVRTLAMQLGVNPNTVERAYAELERRGFVRTFPKKGAFVCAPPDADAVQEARVRIRALRAAGLKKEDALAVIEEVYGESVTGGKND